MMARTAQDYIELVQHALAAGFTTKTAQQDAVAYLNQGWDRVRDAAMQAIITEANAKFGTDDDWTARIEWINAQGYYDLPMYVHHLRGRHYAMLRDQADIARQLVGLLVDVKASPVIKAPAGPTKQQIEDALRMTCQCCGRPVHANTGQIAHHGYERPGMGWQTASCEGARELPFEASRDALGRYINRLLARKLAIGGSLDHINEPGRKFSLTLANYDAPRTGPLAHRFRQPITIVASDDTFEEQCTAAPQTMRTYGLRSWEGFQARVKRELETQLDSVASELKRQQARFDGWTQTHTWNADKAEWRVL